MTAQIHRRIHRRHRADTGPVPVQGAGTAPFVLADDVIDTTPRSTCSSRPVATMPGRRCRRHRPAFDNVEPTPYIGDRPGVVGGTGNGVHPFGRRIEYEHHLTAQYGYRALAVEPIAVRTGAEPTHDADGADHLGVSRREGQGPVELGRLR